MPRGFLHIASPDASAGEIERALTARLSARPSPAPLEQGFRPTLDAFDRDCARYINPRNTGADVTAGMLPLNQRIAALEAGNAGLRM